MFVTIVLVVFSVFGLVFDWLGKLERYPKVEKIVEARLLRTVLLIVAIILLVGVFQDINAVREDLKVPPPAPKTPPAPVFIVEYPATRSNANPQRPSVAQQVNNAPNGIAIGGGTVTNPTVNNFAAPNRQLTSQQIRSMKSSAQALCSTLPRIDVTASNANQEAQRYALGFVNVLKSGGCGADLALPIPGLTPDVIGVYVGVRDMRNLGPTAEALKQMSSGARIPYLVAPMKPDFFPDKQTVLVIGASE